MLYRLTSDGHVEVRVDGPYGEDFERPKWGAYEVLVIFAGGIGVGIFLLACTLVLRVLVLNRDVPPDALQTLNTVGSSCLSRYQCLPCLLPVQSLPLNNLQPQSEPDQGHSARWSCKACTHNIVSRIHVGSALRSL